QAARALPGWRFRPTGPPLRRSAPAGPPATRRSPVRSAKVPSHRQLEDQRDVVRRPLPAAARFEHPGGGDLRQKCWSAPHMIEAAAAIAGCPILGAVAPPGEVALRSRDELAAKVDPLMRCLEARQCLDFDRRMADDVKQRLVVPDVAFQGRDVEVADDQSRLSQLFRPAGHSLDEVELLAELWVLLAVGNIASSRDVNIFQSDPARPASADTG